MLLLSGLPGCGALEGDLAAELVQLVASTEDNFRSSRSLSVIVEPQDLELYRSLLPESFAMPRNPLLSLTVADQLEVGPWPLTTYQLGVVSLRCAVDGEEGWHPVTMPENKWVAIWTGRTMGFPKYMADEIRLVPVSDGWLGQVRDDSELRLRLEFSPEPEAESARWEQEAWPTDGPTFNLRPPREGPEIKIVRNAQGEPASSDVQRGVVRITIGDDEPWAGLVAPGTQAPGFLVDWRGGRSLAPEG